MWWINLLGGWLLIRTVVSYPIIPACHPYLWQLTCWISKRYYYLGVIDIWINCDWFFNEPTILNIYGLFGLCIICIMLINSYAKQAKTTKKIVLRLQCQGCKHVSQHAIKVRCIWIFLLFSSFGFYLLHLCWWLVSSLWFCRDANILRLVETRRERALLFSKCSYLVFMLFLFWWIFK